MNAIPCAIAHQHWAPAPARGTLSLIIPTYNRARMLIETLEHLLPQIIAAQDRVEVIVSDNASTDKTHAICQKWAAAHPWFSYVIHAENVGTARQLFLGAQRARTPYVWMFGDDDGVRPGGIAQILDILDSQDVAFLTLNREVRDRNMKTVLTPAVNSAPSYRFEKLQDLLTVLSVYQLGFISTQILRCDLFNAIDPAPYITSEGYLHFAAYTQAFKDAPAYYCADPLVIHRFNNFSDRNASVLGNTLSLTLPLLRALHIAYERAGYAPNFDDIMCGTKNTSSHDTPATAKMSDVILEKLLVAVDYGHIFSREDWAELTTLSLHWRPAARQTLQIVQTTAQQMAALFTTCKALDDQLAALKKSRDIPRPQREQESIQLSRQIQALRQQIDGGLRQMMSAAAVIGIDGSEALLAQMQPG